MTLPAVALPDGSTAPEPLVRRAAGAVRYAIRSAVFVTDPVDREWPLDIALRTAIEDAIAEQATALFYEDQETSSLRDSKALSPLGRPLKEASIGGARYVADESISAAGRSYQLSEWGLSLASWEILRDAGLLNGVIHG